MKETPEDMHKGKALELANKGIAFDASGSVAEAAQCWRAASDYADTYLGGEDIYYWIKSGFGAALYEIGDFHGGIAVSEIALDWCSNIGQPLPALTLVKCYLRLGDQQAARNYLDHACQLRGDAVLEHFAPQDRELLQNE